MYAKVGQNKPFICANCEERKKAGASFVISQIAKYIATMCMHLVKREMALAFMNVFLGNKTSYT